MWILPQPGSSASRLPMCPDTALIPWPSTLWRCCSSSATGLPSMQPLCSRVNGPFLRISRSGKKLGIIGFGHIGQRVGEMACSFGMEILAYNPHNRNRQAPFPVTWLNLGEVFAEADAVSLHCPLTAENTEFVDAVLLATMKKNA